MTPTMSTVTYTKNSYFRSRPYGRPFVPVDTNSVIHKLLVLLVLQYWWCTWSVYRASRAHHSTLCYFLKPLILYQKLKLLLGLWNNMRNKFVVDYLLKRFLMCPQIKMGFFQWKLRIYLILKRNTLNGETEI